MRYKDKNENKGYANSLSLQDILDRDIVRPIMELNEIIKLIQKTITKRNHKLIDYDRHRLSLQKLNAKTERSFSEEKQIFKVKK